MQKIPNSAKAGEQQTGGDSWADESSELEFSPLTHEQARAWRASQPKLSMWRVVAFQLAFGLLVGAVGWLFTRSTVVLWSVWYGAFAVTAPTALMVYGLSSGGLSKLLAVFFGNALASFLFWEGVKVVLVILLLAMAPGVIRDLNWLGLLAGLVVSLKVYWFGFLIQSRRSG